MAMVDCHALGEQHDRSLGRRIHRPVACAIDAQHLRNVNDRAASDLAHVRQHRARKQPQSANVDVEGLVPLILGDLFSRSRVKNSGVIDQDVDFAERSQGALNNVFNFGFFRDIRSQGKHGSARLSGNLFDPMLATADQNNVSAFPDQGQGAGATDSATGTSHNGNLVLEARAHKQR